MKNYQKKFFREKCPNTEFFFGLYFYVFGPEKNSVSGNFSRSVSLSKVISITRLQANELLVASEQVVSCKPERYKLLVYHIVNCEQTCL